MSENDNLYCLRFVLRPKNRHIKVRINAAGSKLALIIIKLLLNIKLLHSYQHRKSDIHFYIKYNFYLKYRVTMQYICFFNDTSHNYRIINYNLQYFFEL